MVIVTTILTMCMQACILDESARISLCQKTVEWRKRTTHTKHEWNDAVISFFSAFFLPSYYYVKQKCWEKNNVFT